MDQGPIKPSATVTTRKSWCAERSTGPWPRTGFATNRKSPRATNTLAGVRTISISWVPESKSLVRTNRVLKNATSGSNLEGY